MKNKKRNLIIVFVAVLVIAVSAVVIINVSHAYFGYTVNLDMVSAFSSMADYIVEVNITENDHLYNLSSLSTLPNLYRVNIKNQRIDDISVFNNINFSSNLSIFIENSIIDLDGIDISRLV